jgi:hypothetical protein
MLKSFNGWGNNRRSSKISKHKFRANRRKFRNSVFQRRVLSDSVAAFPAKSHGVQSLP